MTSDRAALDRPLRTRGRSRGAALWAVPRWSSRAPCRAGATSGDDDPTRERPDLDAARRPRRPTPPPTSDVAGRAAAPPPTSGDPVPSPIINKAVKAAIEDDFPALVPAGVPDGWTVVIGGVLAQAAAASGAIASHRPERRRRHAASSPRRGVDALVRQTLGRTRPAGRRGRPRASTAPAPGPSTAATRGTAIAKELSGTSAVVVGTDQDTVVIAGRGAAHRRGQRQRLGRRLTGAVRGTRNEGGSDGACRNLRSEGRNRTREVPAAPHQASRLVAGAPRTSVSVGPLRLVSRLPSTGRRPVRVALDRGDRAPHRRVDRLRRAVGLRGPCRATRKSVYVVV